MCAKSAAFIYAIFVNPTKKQSDGRYTFISWQTGFYADEVWFLFHECTVAKFLAPDWRDINDSAGWRDSTTALCQSRLYPPFRDSKFGLSTVTLKERKEVHQLLPTAHWLAAEQPLLEQPVRPALSSFYQVQPPPPTRHSHPFNLGETPYRVGKDPCSCYTKNPRYYTK
jgi:hypothetical protein